MTKENTIIKIIYKDTWYDVMTMQSGGKIEYELFPDGCIGLGRYDAEGNCLEKTRSKMAEAKDFDALTVRLEKRLSGIEEQSEASAGGVMMCLIRSDGNECIFNCGSGTIYAALGNQVWDYLQQFAMSSDAFI